MAERLVLITGADGYLGRLIAERYLAHGDERLLLWLHGDDPAALAAKRERLLARLGGAAHRVAFAHGDLTQPQPFAGIAPAGVDAIIHTAAVTRFNVDADTARRVNVEGTRKLLEFAAACPSLRALGLLSSVYASGLAAGRIDEGPCDGAAGFANEYERSKWGSEALLLSQFPTLPWRIFRIATAIADDESGAVGAQNAVHTTLKLLFYGLLSLIPGRPATPLYLVTGRFAAEAIHELMRRDDAGGIYHLAHRRDESLALGELIGIAFRAFAAEEDFRARRILEPLWVDADGFDQLTRGLESFSGPVNQALASVAPFARQLFVDKDIGNQRLVAALPDYRAPDPRLLVANMCAGLARTRWGKYA